MLRPEDSWLLQASPYSSMPLKIASETRSTPRPPTSTHTAEPDPQAFTSTVACQHSRWSLATLEDTLDWMHDTGEHFLGGYVMCSSLERCEGGQGLVQFCHRVNRKEEYAIKCAPCACLLACTCLLFAADDLDHLGRSVSRMQSAGS